MNIRSLTRGDGVVIGAAVLLLIASFLDIYSFEGAPDSAEIPSLWGSGPVVLGVVLAGVIGSKRFLYDLWGDTVNIASRMESQGVPGGVQLSAATAGRLDPNAFVLEERGVLDVKGRGPMHTYFLRRAH